MTTETYVISGNKAVILKDPDAILDYTWDWTAYLTDIADEIEDYLMFAELPLVVESHSRNGNKITAFISGGVADTTPTVTCRIITENGRTDDRTITMKIVER